MAFSRRVVIVQQRRCPHELERPQAGVAEDVDQGDVTEPQADLGHDDPDLGQRGERQGRLDVGLHAAGEVREDGGRQAQSDDHAPRARATSPGAG